MRLPPGGGGSAVIAPSRDTGNLLRGLELALIRFVFLGAGISLGGWYSRQGAAVMGPGIAVSS